MARTLVRSLREPRAAYNCSRIALESRTVFSDPTPTNILRFSWLEAEELPGVTAQDAVLICCGKIQCFDDRVGPFEELLGTEGVVGTHYHSVGSNQVHEETQGLQIKRQGVVVEAPDVVLKGVLQRELLARQAVLHSSGEVREAATGMRQHNLQFRKLIERAGDDELSCGGGGLKRESESVPIFDRFRERPAEPGLRSAIIVHFPIHGMKQQRK